MSENREQGPRESEVSVGEWLEQIGATAIEFVGDKCDEGPPDYLIEYDRETIAVEVTRLLLREGNRSVS